MKDFYKKAIGMFIALVILTVFMLYLGDSFSKRGEVLFPVGKSITPWVASKEPVVNSVDEEMLIGGGSSYLEYSFRVSPKEQYSYTAYILDFLGATENNSPIDYTQYRAVSFRVLCQPKNVLLFAVFSMDDQFSISYDTSTHRVSSDFFTCDEEWQDVVINFDEVETPDWWLERNGFLLTSDRYFQRDKISAFRFVNSLQSPRGVQSKVKIAQIKLLGENRYFIYFSYALVLVFWLLYLFWLTRNYFQYLILQSKDKVRKDLPIVAYQKLSIAPHKDKEKDAVLRFMATQYSDAEINVERAISQLGINRHKINDLLKSELGLTFSSYLNKLRLAEAARLLVEEAGMNISEVAYAVGYNNVSYFARLFKAEYGCSPKAFKSAKN